MSKNTFHLVSLGCAKNTVDSDSMAQLLLRDGYSAMDDLDNGYDAFAIDNSASEASRFRSDYGYHAGGVGEYLAHSPNGRFAVTTVGLSS